MTAVSSILYYFVLPIFLGCAIWFFIEGDDNGSLCHTDFANQEQRVCRISCPHGYFSLPGMDECKKWLTCQDIQSTAFQVLEQIGGGAVKKSYHALWKNHKVVYNHLANPEYWSDFRHGLSMLVKFHPSSFVTQLLGYCKDSFITEYHQFKSANHLQSILKNPQFQQYDTINTRYTLCINYIQIIDFLHNHPNGTWVMCDSNDINKTLEQFLLTDDLKLVLNDLDALPLINKKKATKIKCGHRELFGDFVAPEQLWPYEDREFNDKDMLGYDEKTDIWKIPDVCEHFLGSVIGSDPVRFKLFKIHQACKMNNPAKRPNISEVLEEYIKAQEEFDLL